MAYQRIKDRPLTVEEVRARLSYDPKTGELRWKNGRNAGKIAGWAGENGRRTFWFGGQFYKGSRIAWAIFYGVWPDRIVDHKNNDPTDNSLENLRLATDSQSNANLRISSRNKCGRKGVSFHKASGLYHARAHLNKKTYSLGYYKNADDAHAAYVAASEKLHGEFANAG